MSRKKTHKSEYSAFAKNIKLLIKYNEHGNKQDFADAVGCSYETVRRWCNGENLPDGAQLLTINDIYEVPIDWLLLDKKPPLAKEMASWAPETQEACRKIKKILESDDKTTAAALHMNINAFEQSIDRFNDNQELRKDIDELKEEVKQLRKIKTLEASADIDSGVLSNAGKRETLYTPALPVSTSVQESQTKLDKKPSTK